MMNLIVTMPRCKNTYEVKCVNTERRTEYRLDVPNTGNAFVEMLYALKCLRPCISDSTYVYCADSNDIYNAVVTYNLYDNIFIPIKEFIKQGNGFLNVVKVKNNNTKLYMGMLKYLRTTSMVCWKQDVKVKILNRVEDNKYFNLLVDVKQYDVTDLLYSIYIDTNDGYIPLSVGVFPIEDYPSLIEMLKLDCISILNAIRTLTENIATLNLDVNTDLREVYDYLNKNVTEINSNNTIMFINSISQNSCTITTSYLKCLINSYKIKKNLIYREKTLLFKVVKKYVNSILNAKFKTSFIEPKDIQEINDFINNNIQKKRAFFFI